MAEESVQGLKNGSLGGRWTATTAVFYISIQQEPVTIFGFFLKVYVKVLVLQHQYRRLMLYGVE